MPSDDDIYISRELLLAAFEGDEPVFEKIRAMLLAFPSRALPAAPPRPMGEAPRDDWKPIKDAPKDGRVILVCLPRMMNLIVRARFNTIHKHWLTDCESDGGISNWTYFHPGDMWMDMPVPPHPAAPEDKA